MVGELVEIEVCLLGKRILDVTEQIDRQQSATVIRAQRNLAARIGGYRYEAFVGIAVGNTLANNRIPEQNPRFRRFPSVVNDFVPQLFGIYLLYIFRIVRVYRELLSVWLACLCGTHKFVIYLYGDVGTRNLVGVQFGIDEFLGIRMLD